MQILANAKINLSLDVLGTLPNGYHEVSMIMQSIDLHDVLNMEKNDSGCITLSCDKTELPCDSSNLIIRAASKLMEYTGSHDGVDITLHKNIPMAAGLAGGSADAAAALIGINRLFGYGLDIEELKRLGATLGADIPFCIQGGTCLAEGIGEKLSDITPLPDCHIVLIKPVFDVSTKYVYDNLILNGDTIHPDVAGMAELIKKGDLHGVCSLVGNILETVTVVGYPAIDSYKKALIEAGALGSLMSGSGPTVYGLFDDASVAENAVKAIEAGFKDAGADGYDTICICHPAREGVIVNGA